MGDMALGDISRHFVREWIAELSTEMAPASVHKTVGVLRQVLAMAMVDNRLTMNPVDGVELPPVDGLREQRFLTLERSCTRWPSPQERIARWSMCWGHAAYGSVRQPSFDGAMSTDYGCGSQGL